MSGWRTLINEHVHENWMKAEADEEVGTGNGKEQSASQGLL